MIDKIAAGILMLSLIVTLTYMRRRIGGRMSLSLLLFASLFIIHGIPMIVYLYETGPDTLIYEAALANVPSRQMMLAKVMFAVSFTFFGLMAGSELGLLIAARWKRIAARSFTSQPVGEYARVIRIRPIQYIVLWTLVLVILAVSLDQSQPSHIIEFFRFDGADIEKTLLRSEEGGTPYYIYNVLLYSIAPFLVMISWANDIRRSSALRPGLLTLSLFAVVLLGKFGTLSKSPPVIFLLQLLLMKVLIRSDRLTFRMFLQLIIAGLVLFVIIVHLTFPELDLSALLHFLYYRVFDIPNEALLEYFSAIPASIPHTWGHDVLARLGLVSLGGSIETYFAVAEITRGSILSSSNAMFIGDAWAQFAWAGVIAMSLFAGFLVRLIDLRAQAYGRSDLAACITAGGAFGVFTSLSTSFTTALVTGGLAVIPFLAASFVDRSCVRQAVALYGTPAIEGLPEPKTS